MIDQRGFRLGVGIVLMNAAGKLFWGKRIKQREAWQFPQGGIQDYETTEEALYRELEEELGLLPTDVELIVNRKSRKYAQHSRNVNSSYKAGEGWDEGNMGS